MAKQREQIKIIVADDIPKFIVGIKMFIEDQLNYNVIGEAANGLVLVSHPLLMDADIILIDCEMPVMNGIEAAKRVNYKFPDKKMIAITMYQEKVYLNDLICAGFKGYVYKPDIVEKLGIVIKNVLNNEFDFTNDLNIA